MRRRPSAVARALRACAVALAGCGGTISGPSIPTTALNGAFERIPAALHRPDGPGPFPAIVIMHDCSGLGPTSSGAPARWARELVGRGYVALVPDSFTTRGHAGGVCTNPSPSRAEVSPFRRVRDAYAALAYLRTLPDVDARRVGLMGGSHGGSTTLATMVTLEGDLQRPPSPDAAGFAAAVALYPGCAFRYNSRSERPGVYAPLAPLLILIGEKDDWTPAAPCRKLAEAAQTAGYPVAVKIYPGAHHSFDSDKPVRYVAMRINVNSPTGRGATTGGDPQAWDDAIAEVAAFFGRHLRQVTP